MQNLRTYGTAPYSMAVVHGGPGAAGEMAPVARELASDWGVLEPLQTATSLAGQVDELRNVLERNGDLPVTLIGFSWGAWLSFLLAARSPALVRKLILVGSGGFEERYAAELEETRLGRLSEKDRVEVRSLLHRVEDPAAADKGAALARLGTLLSKADAYDALRDASHARHAIDLRADIFQNVWREAADLRRSGELLSVGRQIQCPVVAIHGDYDPHPAEGVQKPLSVVLPRFRFVLLKNCGHKPWIERQARDEFYRVLRDELRRGS
jgi:pimeloyl-ACP methyl ester carboxylesterase